MLIDISHTAIHGCFKQLDYDLDLNLSPFARNAGVITPKSIMEATYRLVHCTTLPLLCGLRPFYAAMKSRCLPSLST